MQATKTYRATEDGVRGFVDGLDAVQQAVWHILNTERYAYAIYPDWYGVELQQYIGKGFAYLQSTIQNTLRDALVQDDRVISVTVTDCKRMTADSALVVVAVGTVYGNMMTEVNALV